MFLVAKETGWAEEYLMNMPIAKLWAYRHAILASYDVECHYKTDDIERAEMHTLFNQLAAS